MPGEAAEDLPKARCETVAEAAVPLCSSLLILQRIPGVSVRAPLSVLVHQRYCCELAHRPLESHLPKASAMMSPWRAPFCLQRADEAVVRWTKFRRILPRLLNVAEAVDHPCDPLLIWTGAWVHHLGLQMHLWNPESPPCNSAHQRRRMQNSSTFAGRAEQVVTDTLCCSSHRRAKLQMASSLAACSPLAPWHAQPSGPRQRLGLPPPRPPPPPPLPGCTAEQRCTVQSEQGHERQRPQSPRRHGAQLQPPGTTPRRSPQRLKPRPQPLRRLAKQPEPPPPNRRRLPERLQPRLAWTQPGQ
mmetsp:Transcript_64968/g.116837  ORF Transcript_64968/g.116837 Transcript_64968/m.116837 type:complete len:301 (-) Transcript_64968:980-1882(-)